jgi:predicted enzyme related to lactoylglutathione lyase
MTYSVIEVNEVEVAGLMPMPPGTEEMPPTWGIYLTVDNVEETAEKVKSLGGKVLVEPMDIPDVGRFCVIQDPQGAMLSIISYKS